MIYILYKHKPSNNGWYYFSATTAWKGYLVHSNQRSPYQHRAENVFSVQLKKVFKINEIKKAQKVQDNCSLVETGNGQFVYH